jgi:hypothetical protein
MLRDWSRGLGSSLDGQGQMTDPGDDGTPSVPRSRNKIAAVELARVLFSVVTTIAVIITGYYAIKWLIHK